MANKGKRMIFTDTHTLEAIEGIATAAIRPGSLVVQSATGLTESAAAATVFGGSALFADYDMLAAKTVDDSWTATETAICRQLSSGKHANVLVKAGSNITSRGVGLSSSGDGTLKIALTDGTEQILCVADEIINTGAAVALVRVRGV